MTVRRFPPPWSVEETDASFMVGDSLLSVSLLTEQTTCHKGSTLIPTSSRKLSTPILGISWRTTVAIYGKRGTVLVRFSTCMTGFTQPTGPLLMRNTRSSMIKDRPKPFRARLISQIP
jgi:hypothetical protein